MLNSSGETDEIFRFPIFGERPPLRSTIAPMRPDLSPISEEKSDKPTDLSSHF